MTTIQEEIKDFVRRAVIATDPQEAVKEYFLSKQEDRDIKKYPEWDKPRVYPAFEVVRARCELEKTEARLHAKWLEQQKKRKFMDEQWEQMRRQELILRESFIKFNRFVKENQEKRDRADTKVKEERERQTIRQEEIKQINENLKHMYDVRDRMKKHVQEYQKYSHYLDRVIAETGEFQSIADIFNRYETLIEARSVLTEHQDKNLHLLEERGTEMHHMTESKAQEILGLNNMLAQLQARRDKAEVQARKWESIVSEIKVTAMEKTLEHTQVKTCCWNLYQQICKRKDIPMIVSKDDIEQQLDQIKRTIIELKSIMKIAKKRVLK